MKTLFLLILTLTALQAKDTWPPKPFTHVVAYCYDYTKDPRGFSIVFKDGTHHAGIIAPFTLRLNADQTSQLVTLLNTPYKGELGEVDCYDPHHAFVFYDVKWKPVAWIDICFLCENYSPVPALTNGPIDIVSLEKYVKALSIPFYESDADYQKLFNQHHILNPKAPKPAPAGPNKVDPFAEPEEP